MDIIFIHDLQLQTIIGIHDWERAQKQLIHLDLDIGHSTAKAASSDQIVDCIDYYLVSERLKQLADKHPYQLVESFAEAVSRIILDEFGAFWVRVKISKPAAVSEARGVGVIIERGANPDTGYHLVYVGIGSNINRENNIRNAVSGLKNIFGEDSQLKLSPVYETVAVGFEGDNFYNLVASFVTALSPLEVEKKLKQIELDNGRVKSQSKFSARTLDIDLLLYDDRVISSQDVQVPRDEIEKYAFVLAPLADMAPTQVHPLTRQTFKAMWTDMAKTDTGLERIDFSW